MGRKKAKKEPVPEFPKELFVYWRDAASDPYGWSMYGGWQYTSEPHTIPNTITKVSKYVLSGEGQVCSHFKLKEEK